MAYSSHLTKHGEDHLCYQNWFIEVDCLDISGLGAGEDFSMNANSCRSLQKYKIVVIFVFAIGAEINLYSQCGVEGARRNKPQISVCHS